MRVQESTEAIETKVTQMPVVDPMTMLDVHAPSITTPPPVPVIPVSAPESLVIGTPRTAKDEYTKEVAPNIPTTVPATAEENTLKNISIESPDTEDINTVTESSTTSIPDWLKMPEEASESSESSIGTSSSETEQNFHQASDIPDWLKDTTS